MNVTTLEILKYLQEEIHSTVVATVDDEGLPVTCTIDMMDYDEAGLYFLTAKGKNFYDRLIKRGTLALTGNKGEDTMHGISISIRGNVREIGSGYLSRLFAKNRYMEEIYPTETSRSALTVFQIYEGSGEWFDLSKKPIERFSFIMGNIKQEQHGYFVTEQCIGCGSCKHVCPQDCIDWIEGTAAIRQQNCLHCGNCFRVCPVHAIKRS